MRQAAKKGALYITLKQYGSESNALDVLQGCFEITRASGNSRPSASELQEVYKHYDAVIVGAQEKCVALSRDIIFRTKLLGVCAVGTDNIDAASFRRQGIVVVSLSGFTSSESVAEFTLCAILSGIRRTKDADAAVRASDWAWRNNRSAYELSGKTVGIVGLGTIGSRVAELILPFAPNLKCCTLPSDKTAHFVRTHRIEVVRLPELLRMSDVITLHVPLTRRTYHMLDYHALVMTKRDVVIVNTSRGGVVDQKALQRALREEPSRFAVLDVFEDEPKISRELLELNNVQLSPHVAGSTKESWVRKEHELARKMCQKWQAIV